jgi:Zn-dependent protease with chaperone function
MDNNRFDALITRLEAVARDHHAGYQRAVLGVTLLGFGILGIVILYALGPALLLGGFALAVVLTGGKALILLLKLGKLLLLLLIPAWVMIKSSVQLLFMRFPRPEGRVLTREEAPELFRRLDALQRTQNGPHIDHVLIDDEFNAAVVQHPRFGLFGWEENYLILGLPLLQVLSEEEALSVVGHEYGHVSGQHGRLGAFIYRMRATWGTMQALSESWKDWGSRAVARLFEWYAPYFNAYTFVMARQNEYEADRAAAEAFGVQNAANALMRYRVVAHFREEMFWPEVQRKIADHPEPIANTSELMQQILRQKLDEAARVRFLAQARAVETDHMDTHPALKDRLAAFGVVPDDTAAIRLTPPSRSAAEAWLGDRLPALENEIDGVWQEGVRGYWTEQHARLDESRKALQALEGKEALTVDERWERIRHRRELDDDYDPMPDLEALLALEPEHGAALGRHALILLERGDEAGIAELERVMQGDADATLPACEAAWRFYRERSPERAEEYRQRWQARSDYEDRLEHETRHLPADATLVPHGLDEEKVRDIRRILEAHGAGVRVAYLLRRVYKTDDSRFDFVLAFETRRMALGDKGQEIVSRLARQEYPLSAFIVHLGSDTYKGFRKAIREQQIAPIYGN